MELRAKNSRTINAECAGGIVMVENPSPPLPQFRSHATHTISQTLQNLHVESCVDSLTLRCEFVMHNSMAVKKSINMALIFYLLFRDFFGLGKSFCFHSALRLQLDVVLVYLQFVDCDDPFQEFIAFL